MRRRDASLAAPLALALGAASLLVLSGCPPTAATSQPLDAATTSSSSSGAGGGAGGGTSAAGGAGGGGAPRHDVTWAKTFAGTDTAQAPEALAVDANGNAFLALQFDGEIDVFGNGGTFVSTGGTADGMVVKLSGDGLPLWAQALVGGLTLPTSIAIDAKGRSEVAGSFAGTIGWTGAPSTKATGLQDAFVAQLGLTGQAVAAPEAWGSVMNDALGTSIVLTPGGDRLLAGNFRALLHVGGTTLTAMGGAADHDLFVARFGVDGKPLWARSYGSTLDEHAAQLAYDASADEIVVLGRCAGPIDLDLDGVPDPCGGLFITRLTGAGAWRWSHSLELDAGQPALLVSATGAAFVVGAYQSGAPIPAASLGGATLPASAGPADHDPFVLAFDASGQSILHRAYPSAGQAAIASAALTPDGAIALGGYFQGALDLGAPSGELTGNQKFATAFAAKLSPTDGKPSWSTAFAGYGGDQKVAAVAVAPDGSVFLAGTVKGVMQAGDATLTAGGIAADVFVAKLAP